MHYMWRIFIERALSFRSEQSKIDEFKLDYCSLTLSQKYPWNQELSLAKLTSIKLGFFWTSFRSICLEEIKIPLLRKIKSWSKMGRSFPRAESPFKSSHRCTNEPDSSCKRPIEQSIPKRWESFDKSDV